MLHIDSPAQFNSIWMWSCAHADGEDSTGPQRGVKPGSPDLESSALMTELLCPQTTSRSYSERLAELYDSAYKYQSNRWFL